MLSFQEIRDHPEKLDQSLTRRGLPPQSREILALDKQVREYKTQIQKLRTQRNQVAQQISRQAQSQQTTTISPDLFQEAEELRESIKIQEEELSRIEGSLRRDMLHLPNLLSGKVPAQQQVVTTWTWGEPKKPDFPIQDHVSLGERLGMMDFGQARSLSGSGFSLLTGKLALLERALGQYLLDKQTKQGFLEVRPPNLVRAKALTDTGQLPKFQEDIFQIKDRDLYLVPTSEVSLVNMFQGKALSKDDLPLRVTALTPCWRAEAGASGQDTRGMFQVHEFLKVEMVSLVGDEEQTQQELEYLLTCARAPLQELQIPHRTVLLDERDTGFSAKITYDIETWIPSQEKFREISSCSDCGDFQARRAKITCREQKQPVHTLNGSGVAVGRLLIGVMENHQDREGNIHIPEVLQPYMQGIQVIRP